MSLRKLLIDLAPVAVSTTGQGYYDATYPGLLGAGRVIRDSVPQLGSTACEAAIVLAHGLAGWNTGESRHRAAEALLKAAQTPGHSDLCELASLLRPLDRDLPTATQRRREVVAECFLNLLGCS